MEFGAGAKTHSADSTTSGLQPQSHPVAAEPLSRRTIARACKRAHIGSCEDLVCRHLFGKPRELLVGKPLPIEATLRPFTT